MIRSWSTEALRLSFTDLEKVCLILSDSWRFSICVILKQAFDANQAGAIQILARAYTKLCNMGNLDPVSKWKTYKKSKEEQCGFFTQNKP